MMNVKRIATVLIGLVLSVVAITCMFHRDLEYISTWGVALLEHIHQGNLSNYAIDLFQIEYGTNYNLFQNLNVALWCLPIYLVSMIGDLVIPMFVYQTWIKVVIALIHVLCTTELHNVICLLGFDKHKANIAALLYYCSPVVILHGIGIGQIDCLGILFFLVSIRFLLEKRYFPMSIFMGLALLSKFFVVFFYVPLFLLNFDKVKYMIKYVCIALCIPVIDKIITNLLIDSYSLQADVHNTDSFIPRLFHWSLGGESIILLLILIICGICLMIGIRGKSKQHYYFLFPSVMFFMFLLLVFWHPQWFVYILPVLLVMGCYSKNESEYAFFYTGLMGGFALHSLVNCNWIYFNAMLVSESFLGRFVIRTQRYIGDWIMNNVSEYIGNVGYTIFMASFALLIILFYLNVVDKNTDKSETKVSGVVWGLIATLPSAVYMAVILGVYLFV